MSLAGVAGVSRPGAPGVRLIKIDVDTVTGSDFRGLRRLAEAAGSRFARGVVLYDGETCAPFGDRLHAVPIRALWERG